MGSGAVGGHDTCRFDSIWSNAPGVFPVGTTVVQWFVSLNGVVIDSCSQNVTRRPPSVYTIKFGTSPPIVAGVIHICNGQSITFTDSSVGTTGRLWNFGNGYYSSNAIHTEPASHYPPGTYFDTLRVFDDCNNPHDTAFKVIVDSSGHTPVVCCTICMSVICNSISPAYSRNAINIRT